MTVYGTTCENVDLDLDDDSIFGKRLSPLLSKR